MKVYIAARFARMDEVREITERLILLGVEVTSQWIYEPPMPSHSQEKFKRETGLMDLRDVREADALVVLSDPLDTFQVPSSWATGGRHFESGYAYALGKPVIVVGEPQNVFHNLPNMVHLKNVEELYRYLSPTEVH